MTSKNYDADDMDGIYDEMENPDDSKIYDHEGRIIAEDPTEEQKNFYLANNPCDIEQRRKWNKNKKKSNKKDIGNGNSEGKEEKVGKNSNNKKENKKLEEEINKIERELSQKKQELEKLKKQFDYIIIEKRQA